MKLGTTLLIKKDYKWKRAKRVPVTYRAYKLTTLSISLILIRTDKRKKHFLLKADS